MHDSGEGKENEVDLNDDVFDVRPFIICHTQTSLNGKARGPFQQTAAGQAARLLYDETLTAFMAPAWLIGADELGTNQWDATTNSLDDSGAEVPQDFHAPSTTGEGYAVVLTADETIGFETGVLEHPGRPTADVIAVVTENVSPFYLRHLRDRGISYLTAGAESVDLTTAVQKLRSAFGIEALVVLGGPEVNGAFLNAELVDEISLVICPAIDAALDAPSIFLRPSSLDELSPTSFDLVSAQALEGGLLWTRYRTVRQ